MTKGSRIQQSVVSSWQPARPHARPWDRGQHRHLQRGQRRPAQAFACEWRM